MLRKNLWRGRKVAGTVAALAVAGTMAATAMPALASPESATPSSVAMAASTVSPNPELPQKCGLNLAMVFDMSNSMGNSDVNSVKSASSAAVSALQGTATTLGIYSFATFAKQELPATSVASAQGAASVSASINALSRPGDSKAWLGGTNWQQALDIVPENTYDGVIFFTDGVPTFFGPSPLNGNENGSNGTGGTGVDTSANVTASLNAAIPEANRLKGAGTRIIGVGVEGADSARLSQITGPVSGSDYFATNYDELAKTLKDIATAGCTGTLNVNKAVQASDSTDVTPGEGWVFDTAAEGSDAKVLTTASNGQAGMTLNFPEKQPVKVTIKERQQPGFSVVQNNGFNAVCTRDGKPLEVTNTADAGNVGFDVTAEAGTITSCTVTNKAPASGWTMEKTSDTDGTVKPGDTITYKVAARNTGELAVGGITFSDDLSNVLNNATFVPGSATLTVDGGIAAAVADPAGNELIAGPITLSKGESAVLSYQVRVNADANDVTLTNAVTGTGQVPPAECIEDAPCTTTDVVPAAPEPSVTPTPTDEPSNTPEPTVAPTVEPTESVTPTEIPSVTETPSATDPASSTAKPSTSATVPPKELAHTGASALLPLIAGGVLLVGGTFMLVIRRGRRTH